MTAHGLFALLFAPSGQNAGAGLPIFLIQIGALIAIFYFMLIRPQRRQQERHRQLLASLGLSVSGNLSALGHAERHRSERRHDQVEDPVRRVPRARREGTEKHRQ